MKTYRSTVWMTLLLLLGLLAGCNLTGDNRPATPSAAPKTAPSPTPAVALTIIPVQPDVTEAALPSPSLPPAPATATTAPMPVILPTATTTPTATPAPLALNRKDPKSVIEWIRAAVDKKDPAMIAQLAGDKLAYSNYIEGGQPMEKPAFITDLSSRLVNTATSPVLCDAYSTYEKTLQVWTSGWTPEWQIDKLCYNDCAPLSPPFKSRKAAFFLTPNPQTGEYELTNIWLAEDKIWREVYKVQMHSCTDAYIPPPAVIACSGAPLSRLQKSGYLYGNTTSTTSNNVRSSPGTGANVLGLLPPGKAAQIVDGPQCVEGYVWWKIRTLTGTLTGWTAEGKGTTYYLVPCGDPEKCGKP